MTTNKTVVRIANPVSYREDVAEINRSRRFACRTFRDLFTEGMSRAKGYPVSDDRVSQLFEILTDRIRKGVLSQEAASAYCDAVINKAR